jgi:hypothetical protein
VAQAATANNPKKEYYQFWESRNEQRIKTLGVDENPVEVIDKCDLTLSFHGAFEPALEIR